MIAKEFDFDGGVIVVQVFRKFKKFGLRIFRMRIEANRFVMDDVDVFVDEDDFDNLILFLFRKR